MARRKRHYFPEGLAFVAPWLLGFAMFTVIPVALSLYYSFCDYAITAPSHRPMWIGLENFRDLWRDALFWKSLRNTLDFACMALPAGILVSVGLALVLNAKIRGLAVYRTIIFLPSLVPTVASAVLWLWLFNGRLGLINHLLQTFLGIQGPHWLGPEMAMPSLAFMSLWGVGHTVIIYLAGLQDIPVELLEAAAIDGAGPLRRLIAVTLPLLTPVIFFNLIMAIIGTFSVLTVPYIMTLGGPNNATYFYTMYSYDEAFRYLHMGYASAMAWIQLVIVLFFTAIAFWSARTWVHYE